jgi:hypothetical protein
MSIIPDSHRDLIDTPHIATLSTVGPDGAPQVTALWYLADGHTVAKSLMTKSAELPTAARPSSVGFGCVNLEQSLSRMAGVALSDLCAKMLQFDGRPAGVVGCV